MINIVLDPYNLIFPGSSEVSQTDVENYIYYILNIDEQQKEKSLNIYICENMNEILSIEDGYPHNEKLKETIKKVDLQGIFQPRDLIAAITKILKFDSFEKIIQVEEVLFQNNFIKDIQAVRNQEEPPAEKEDFQKLLLYLHLANQKDNNNFLASTSYASKKINFSGELIEVQPSNSPITPKEIPTIYNASIFNVNQIIEVYPFLDIVSLWKKAESTTNYSLVFELYLKKEGLDYEENWSFHPKFFDSVTNKGFDHIDSNIKSLLKVMKETIFDENLSTTHSLREKAGANSPQRMNGNKKAFRRDIDDEYHLHYWREANEFQFAKVVDHNDMHIPY